MSVVLLREVPVDSPVHRLWAGTKMIAAFAISVLMMIQPTWPVLAVSVAFLVVIGLAARLPLGTLPRLPWWFWALIGVGALLNIPGGSAAVIRYAQMTLLGLILLTTSFLIAWTTPLGEIAPALAKLGAPLRKLRVPVDEWAVVVALTLRGLPLLMEEMRVLRAARRLRPRDSALQLATDNPLVDILTAAMAVSTRRAGELGEAITARGGTGQLTAHPSAPGRRDAIALAMVFAVYAGAVAIDILL
ncbi:energy-coupling factor transporter transmembrane component T family protein [Nocardia transvalensis]|uniref:energy-coupling factor transporter transmembrane component T family protein n=1 Tax=Nocardia transvalensis TaxID=37333 RepID=UPI001893EDC4|nr:energy-coupling factor transporter transmembrane protein EcfT [Nocardia transvalensis]MBF6334170.1 energy-coupling factor transporter transmembrane protein EcfT [Nocardia transvalensis]